MPYSTSIAIEVKSILDRLQSMQSISGTRAVSKPFRLLSHVTHIRSRLRCCHKTPLAPFARPEDERQSLMEPDRLARKLTGAIRKVRRNAAAFCQTKHQKSTFVLAQFTSLHSDCERDAVR